MLKRIVRNVIDWSMYLLIFVIVLLLILFILGGIHHVEKTSQMMTECKKERKEYECYAIIYGKGMVVK